MKKVKWILIIVLVLIVIFTTMFFVFKNGNKTDSGKKSENKVQTNEALNNLHEVFSFKNSDEISKYGKENEYDYEVDVDYHNLYNVNIFGYKMQVFYLFDNKNNIIERKAVMPLNIESFKDKKIPKYEKLDANLVKSLSEEYFESFCKVFGLEFNEKYYIIGNDGEVFDGSKKESFSKVIAEDAIIEFTLREGKTVWRNELYCVDGALVCEIEHYEEGDLGSEMLTNISCD